MTYPNNPTNSDESNQSPGQYQQQGSAPIYNPGQNPGQFPGQNPGQFPGQFPGQNSGQNPGQFPGQFPGQPGVQPPSPPRGPSGGQPGQFPGQQGQFPGQPGQPGQFPGQPGQPGQQGPYTGQPGQFPGQPGQSGQFAGQFPGQPQPSGVTPNPFQVHTPGQQPYGQPGQPGQFSGQFPRQFPGQPGQPAQQGPYPGQPGQFPGQPGQSGQFAGQFPGQPQPSGNFGYAEWGTRALAWLIDASIPVVSFFTLLIVTLSSSGSGIILPLWLVVIAGIIGFCIWNYCIKQGNTGQTIGKGKTNIKLISEQTGQPLGAGGAFIRNLCHAVDYITGVGFVAPRWTEKKQTYADSIMGTIVVNTKPQLQNNTQPLPQNTNYYQGR